MTLRSVCAAPAHDREARIVARFLLEESRQTTELLTRYRAAGTPEPQARAELASMLPVLAQLAVNKIPDGFLSLAALAFIEHRQDWNAVAEIVAEQWTPDDEERREIEERDEAERKEKGMEWDYFAKRWV